MLENSSCHLRVALCHSGTQVGERVDEVGSGFWDLG